MTAIDHKQEAGNALAVMSELYAGHVAIPNLLAEAQVHATLALVAATEKVAEQARIGNLIAIYDGENTSSIYPGRIRWAALANEIREGLAFS